MGYVPSEISIGGVYFPPLLLAGALGLLATWLTAVLLNRYRLSRFFEAPALVFIGLVVIYTGLFGTFLVKV